MNSIRACFFFALVLLAPALSFADQPNVLWLLTDDQRYDSIRAFNRILNQREHSELGYVESPNVDRLARMGTTFINSYCHSAVCAPSRAAMHYGRYPFRSGIYAFEYHNNNGRSHVLLFGSCLCLTTHQSIHTNNSSNASSS